jgi:uncharacterized protein YdaU (DUF1376 family)
MPKFDRSPYFHFNPADFAADKNVLAMTAEEVGAYILLLCVAWHEEPAGTLPNDDRLLARWARLDDERWAKAKPAILSAFKSGSDGRLHQSRMKREFENLRRAQKEMSARNTKNAKARWHKHLDAEPMRPACESHATGMPSGCDSRAEASKTSSSGEGEPTPRANDDDVLLVVRSLGIDPSSTVKDAIKRHRYGCTDLRQLWAKVVNTPNVGNRKALFVKNLKDGVFA